MKTKPTPEAIEKAAQNYADSLTFNSAYIDADKRDELKASAREDYTAGFKSAIDQIEHQPASTGERLSACEMYKKHFGLSKKEFFIPSDAGSLEVVDVMKAFAAQEVEAAITKYVDVTGAIAFAEFLIENNMRHDGFGGWNGRLNTNHHGSKSKDLYKLFLNTIKTSAPEKGEDNGK